ncbi:glycoside hydrolase superfamily [Mycena vitilis]|nr:glycoside hydrolase superfamily [Mycena vitilis]
MVAQQLQAARDSPGQKDFYSFAGSSNVLPTVVNILQEDRPIPWNWSSGSLEIAYLVVNSSMICKKLGLGKANNRSSESTGLFYKCYRARAALPRQNTATYRRASRRWAASCIISASSSVSIPMAAYSLATSLEGRRITSGLWAMRRRTRLAGARTFASWGADYLKYDNCYAVNSTDFVDDNPPIAIEARINDIGPPASWDNLFRIINQVVPITQFAGPGGWNDLDMLEVGNSGLSAAEQQTHFAFWAAVKSPLIISTDLTKASAQTLGILKSASNGCFCARSCKKTRDLAKSREITQKF